MDGSGESGGLKDLRMTYAHSRKRQLKGAFILCVIQYIRYSLSGSPIAQSFWVAIACFGDIKLLIIYSMREDKRSLIRKDKGHFAGHQSFNA